MSKNHRHRKHHRHTDISRRTKPGAAPGTIAVDPCASAPVLHVIAYGKDQFLERTNVSVAEVGHLLGKHPVVWLNVDGLGDAETIVAVGKLFGAHNLALEDVVNEHQRPKVDDYGSHLFIVVRMIHGGERCQSEQLSIFLGTNFIVTFQDIPGDSLGPVRERLRQGIGRIRESGADYLAYSILDATIDGYYPVIEQLSDRLEDLEDAVISNADEHSLETLRAMKQDLLTIRRAIWPHREAFGNLVREPHAMISDATRVYLRDVYDHVVQVIDLVEVYRELVMDLRDFYMSAISNRINETMRVLTIVSTIFIPITFIVGVYGMNFDRASPWNMPELGWKYGYLGIWGLMIATTTFMLYYFRRQGWIRLRWLFPKRNLPRSGGK